MALKVSELLYLEACMEVADGDGEHAADYGIDCGELQMKLKEEIARYQLIEEGEKWRDPEERGMKEVEFCSKCNKARPCDCQMKPGGKFYS